MNYERKVFSAFFNSDLEDFLNEHSDWEIISINISPKDVCRVVLEREITKDKE